MSQTDQKESLEPDFDGIAVFRALGYIVGLPCFIVGTALFMLGFSTQNAASVSAASVLYSVAIAAIAGRVALLKFNPVHEGQVFVVAGCALLTIAVLYALFSTTFLLLHLPGGFSG